MDYPVAMGVAHRISDLPNQIEADIEWQLFATLAKKVIQTDFGGVPPK